MDGGAAAEAAAVAAAGHDRPFPADDGYGVAARSGPFALFRDVFAEFDDLGALAGAALDLGLGLLDLADLVDQLVSQGLFRRIGAGLDHRLKGGRGRLAVLGGVGQGAVIDGGHPRRHRLAVGGGVVALGVFVDGVLVLVALLEIGADAVFVERPAQEQTVGREAGGLEAGGVLHPQFRRRGADHIGGHHRARRGEALAVSDDRLARGAEAADRLAQLIRRGRGHAAFRQADQHGLDAGVLLGLGQTVHHLGHRQARSPEGRERIGRGLVADPLAQVQFQHHGRGRRRLGGAGDGDRQQNDRDHDDEQDQSGENPQNRQKELLHGKRRARKRPEWLSRTIEREQSPSNERRATCGRSSAPHTAAVAMRRRD